MFTSVNNSWINSTTLNTFTTIYNVSQSSRYELDFVCVDILSNPTTRSALGWDTNNYAIRDYPGCGNFSENTYCHTGYTGTQVCNDKDRQLVAILLTNRVYPAANEASSNAIEAARILFSNMTIGIYDSTVRPELL
jgi:hypothetical protein